MGTKFGKYVKRFYGGDDRGVCYSVMGLDIHNGHYVAIEFDAEEIELLIQELKTATEDTRRTLKQDRVQ